MSKYERCTKESLITILESKDVLLEAVRDLLATSVIVEYDGTECNGACLLEDIDNNITENVGLYS